MSQEVSGRSWEVSEGTWKVSWSLEVKGGSWVVTMRLLKVSGRPLPKAMSISRSEIFRKKRKEKKRDRK